jgi:type I restriction enzyme S subunit
VKHIADVSVSNVDKLSVEGEIPVRLVNYTDVYYGDRLAPTADLRTATATRRQVEAFCLRPGDVVITKDSELADDIGVAAMIESSADDMVLGYHLALLRPRRGLVDGRYLYWAMCSDDVKGQLNTAATGVTRFGLRTEAIKAVALVVPEVSDQRAIAGFLDIETARIDALIANKRRMLDLLEDRFRREVEARTGDGEPRRVRFTTSVITSGPRGWAEKVGDAGRPFIRSANLDRASTDLNFTELARVDVVPTAEATRSQVNVGDVVVGITGANTGWVGVVGPDAAGGFVSQHVAILRPTGVEPHWLAYSIFSNRTQALLLGSQYGGTKPQLGLAELADLVISVPATEVQRSHLEALAVLRTRTQRSQTLLGQQIVLLQEHRQALITAAVTGQLEVPGVSAA